MSSKFEFTSAYNKEQDVDRCHTPLKPLISAADLRKKMSSRFEGLDEGFSKLLNNEQSVGGVAVSFVYQDTVL